MRNFSLSIAFVAVIFAVHVFTLTVQATVPTASQVSRPEAVSIPILVYHHIRDTNGVIGNLGLNNCACDTCVVVADGEWHRACIHH